MSNSIKQLAKVIVLTGGKHPSVILENRFKTAAVTDEGERMEFFRTVTQRVAVSAELFDRLVQDVRNDDQLEVTVRSEDNISTLVDYRVI